jgi:uncharacterized protein (DUF111 family)
LQVETPFGRVLVKVATLPDGAERAMPEFESVLEVAERSGTSPRVVSTAAVQAFLGSAREGAGADR